MSEQPCEGIPDYTGKAYQKVAALTTTLAERDAAIIMLQQELLRLTGWLWDGNGWSRNNGGVVQSVNSCPVRPLSELEADLAAVTTERDSMREALTQLRDHHVARNTQVGRPIADSRTIRIIDIALAAGGSNGK